MLLSFLSFTDMPFKELCVDRLLSAGENEYSTAPFFCQHFFLFFLKISHFFFRGPGDPSRHPPTRPRGGRHGEPAAPPREGTSRAGLERRPASGAHAGWSRTAEPRKARCTCPRAILKNAPPKLNFICPTLGVHFNLRHGL